MIIIIKKYPLTNLLFAENDSEQINKESKKRNVRNIREN